MEEIEMGQLHERSGGDCLSEEWVRYTLEAQVGAIKQLKPEEMTVVKRLELVSDTEILPFLHYLDHLRREGDLDVGGGNHEFGYLVPSRKRGERRELIVYRR